MLTFLRAAALLLVFGPVTAALADDSVLTLALRDREQTSPQSGRWHVLTRTDLLEIHGRSGALRAAESRQRRRSRGPL